MPIDCVIDTDNLHTIPQDRLRQRITQLSPTNLFGLDQALRHSPGLA
jgi:mRNA-degrading endonuclease toxin of MazEF toxin-antitoxin module